MEPLGVSYSTERGERELGAHISGAPHADAGMLGTLPGEPCVMTSQHTTPTRLTSPKLLRRDLSLFPLGAVVSWLL